MSYQQNLYNVPHVYQVLESLGPFTAVRIDPMVEYDERMALEFGAALRSIGARVEYQLKDNRVVVGPVDG